MCCFVCSQQPGNSQELVDRTELGQGDGDVDDSAAYDVTATSNEPAVGDSRDVDDGTDSAAGAYSVIPPQCIWQSAFTQCELSYRILTACLKNIKLSNYHIVKMAYR